MLNVTSELGTYYALNIVTCALYCCDVQYGMPRVALCDVSMINLKLEH
jgi:hypothetical protein